MSIAVRFVLGVDNVDFYEEEISTTPVSYEQPFEYQSNQNGPPVAFSDGSIWASISITFREFYGITKAKIDSLIDYNDTMTCYYAYHSYGTSKSYNVIYYPDGIINTYSYALGDPSALILKTLIFLQVS